MKKLLALSLLLSGCAAYVQPDLPHTVKFENDPCVKPNGARYRTCDELTVNIDTHEYQVPSGFDTDLASVPKLFWSVLSPAEAKMMGPAVLHDYMYQCPGELTRRYADDVFYSSLIESDMKSSQAYQMYTITRLFGGKYFKTGAKCDYLKPKNDQES